MSEATAAAVETTTITNPHSLKQEGSQSLRTTAWVFLAGIVCGGLLILSATALSIGTLLKNCEKTYAVFPSLPTPWFVHLDITLLKDIPEIVLGIPAFIGGSCLGLLIVWAIRPRSILADVDLGFRSGSVAALALFFIGGAGWATVLATTAVPSISDVFDLGRSLPTVTPAPKDPDSKEPVRHPQENLLEKYPDLAGVPEHERGTKLAAKMIADSVVGSLTGIWFGLAMCLFVWVPAGIYQTLAAGFLWRREQCWRTILFPYLEVSVTGTWLALVLLVGIGTIISERITDIIQAEWVVVLGHLAEAGFLTALAWRGALRRWPFAPRWAVLIGSGLALAYLLPEASWGPNVVLAIAGGVAAVLGAVALLQSPKPTPVEPAALADAKTPPSETPIG